MEREIMSILEKYSKAMCANYIDMCIAIEQKYDLYGYPPNIVSIALAAIDKGDDPYDVLESYFEGNADD
jgi:hypothetical protein